MLKNKLTLKQRVNYHDYVDDSGFKGNMSSKLYPYCLAQQRGNKLPPTIHIALFPKRRA